MSSIEVVQPQPAARPLHLLEPVERLPSEQAKKWFLALQQRKADAMTLLQSVSDQLREEVRPDLYREEARRKQLTMPRAAGGFGLAADEPQVVEIDQKIANLKAKVARLTELAADRSARHDRVASPLTNSETLLRRGGVPGGVRIAAATPIDLKDVLRRGENPRAAIERLQLRGRELSADQNRERSRPYPAADAKRKARAAIEARARPPSVTSLIEHNGDLQWPTIMSRLDLAAIGHEQSRVVGNAMGEVEDVVGLLCWIAGDAMADKIDALIDIEADDAEAVTADERAVRLAELEHERLAVERQECAVVWSLMEAGEAVEHRADVSPLALLGLELLTVA